MADLLKYGDRGWRSSAADCRIRLADLKAIFKQGGEALAATERALRIGEDDG